MRKDSTIAELLERLDEEIQNPKDSVHKIVLKITIDNIKKLIKWIESGGGKLGTKSGDKYVVFSITK